VDDVRSAWRGWYAVVVLGSLYVVACVDRLILNLMVEPLRHDLHINDTQVSLLMGAAFAVFYSLVGLPLGRMADIGNRKWLVVSAALVWAPAPSGRAWRGRSGCCAPCGSALRSAKRR
jgi:MFS family permease